MTLQRILAIRPWSAPASSTCRATIYENFRQALFIHSVSMHLPANFINSVIFKTFGFNSMIPRILEFLTFTSFYILADLRHKLISLERSPFLYEKFKVCVSETYSIKLCTFALQLIRLDLWRNLFINRTEFDISIAFLPNFISKYFSPVKI